MRFFKDEKGDRAEKKEEIKTSKDKEDGPISAAPFSLMLEMPVIICCIKDKKDLSEEEEEESAEDLSFIKLEKPKMLNESFYMLKKHVRVHGVLLPVLDVLDTRNTFLWVDTFRKKILAHQWTEEEVMSAFRASVSQEILARIVKDADTLRESIRRIYDNLYTKENVEALERRIKLLKSVHFNDFVQYKNEITLLISSYSVKTPMDKKEKEKHIQKTFWRGLSSNVKQLFSEKISRKTSPERIIKKIHRFRKKIAKQYSLLDTPYKSLVHVKVSCTKTSSPSEGSSSSSSSLYSVSIPSLALPSGSPQDPIKGRLGTRRSVFTSSFAPPPAPLPAVPAASVLLKVVPLPKDLFRTRKKEEDESSRGMQYTPELLSLIDAPYLFVPRTQYRDVIPGKAVVIESIFHKGAVAAILHQDEHPVAVFCVFSERDYSSKTSTEKSVFAMHNALKYFKVFVKHSPVKLCSPTYNTYIPSMRNMQVNLHGCIILNTSQKDPSTDMSNLTN
ncbi:hypothetical protein NECID01_1016 [Nematocida sp. AWRm77]|nr:hypothetical protein NECID01_1016 [Nematocida sp. AWRm77]